MDRNTSELLKECGAGCRMAIGSMEQVMSAVSNPELKAVIGKYNEKHHNIQLESDTMLRNAGESTGSPKSMASAFAWLSTEMKMMVNDSTHQIASLMTDGCNMGIKSLSGYINKYSCASNESIRLAEELVGVEESFMRDLRKFM